MDGRGQSRPHHRNGGIQARRCTAQWCSCSSKTCSSRPKFFAGCQEPLADLVLDMGSSPREDLVIGGAHCLQMLADGVE